MIRGCIHRVLRQAKVPFAPFQLKWPPSNQEKQAAMKCDLLRGIVDFISMIDIIIASINPEIILR